MSIADDIVNALEAGAKAGAAAASTAGRDLAQDIENFVIPHLREIGIQLASITEKRIAGIFTDETAKALIDAQEDSIQTLVDMVATLTALEAEAVVNAIIEALNKTVNTAVGFALLA